MIEYNTIDEFLNSIVEAIEQRGSNDIGIIAPARDTPTFLKYIIQNTDLELASIDLVNTDVDGFAYDDEYIIEINPDGVWCEPAKRGDYVGIADDIVFVMADCNSAILKYIESDFVFDVDIKEACDDSDNCSDDSISHFVSYDNDGNPDGFTVSLTSNKSNSNSRSSFSYFNTNVEALREVAKQFGVTI